MAYNAAGVNVQDKNPYNVTIANGVTAPGAGDVYLVFNNATVLSREDLVLATQMLLEFLYQQTPGQAFGPP